MQCTAIRLALILIGSIVGCSAPEQQAVPANKDALPVAVLAKPAREVSDWHWYRGTLSAIGPDWIELAVGWKQGDAEEWDQNRETLHRSKVYDNSAPKRVTTANTRPAGNLDCEPFLPVSIPAETHLISDLLIGDVVVVSTGITREGHEWVLQLAVARRQGREIPPLHGKSTFGYPLHLQFQAEQNWEEKGVPISKQFLDGRGRARTNPPYPPVAPLPRPATPKP